MARLAGKEPIYEAADLLRQRCLTEQRSLLWPEQRAWIPENLSLLYDAFIGHPDTSDKSFYEKWEVQLGGLSLDCHRVAADVVGLYNLFPMSISADEKRRRVRQVIGWKLGDPPENVSILEEAFQAEGIGSPGPYYNLGRHWQFAFYLKFAELLLTARVDPYDLDACKQISDESVDVVSTKGLTARHILFHLLFPEHFERIASQKHKKLIVQRFSELSEGATDLDEALANIRQGLVEETGREDLDFYDPDLREKWLPPTPKKKPKKGAGVAADGPRYWIEKTKVKGRPDREEGAYALGKALWSPEKAKDGSDIYRFMRDVQPDDLILHLTDNQAFTGVSVAASGCEGFDGIRNTEWGTGPSYLVRLSDFRKLDPALDREIFFGPDFRDRLVAIAQSGGVKNLFFTQTGELNQGAYLTPGHDSVLEILNDAYQEISGRTLTGRQGRAYWIFQASPKLYDLQGALTELSEINWRTAQHAAEIRAGDRVFIWESGPSAGIMAVAEVLAAPSEMGMAEDELRYVLGDATEFDKVRLRVPIRTHDILKNRLLRDELLQHPQLKDLRILRSAQGTNFPVTAEEAELIEGLLSDETPALITNPTYSLAECAADTGFNETLLARWVRAIERKGQAIFSGPPGTGKTFIAEKIAAHLIGGSTGFWELVQFHPSYGYEDFIQGIRPKENEDGELSYPMVDGRFLEFCKMAAQRGDDRCVLVVDEINRANLSRVFGELMYLLEYRNREVPLAGGGTLRIPSNVRLIGTMNTADRSIALVDHALRRRFAFFALQPEYEILRLYHEREETGYPVSELIEVLRRVNRQIDDPNYEVGITFFLQRGLRDDIEDIWRMEIEPYLAEYFFDQPQKVDDLRWDKIQDQLGA